MPDPRAEVGCPQGFRFPRLTEAQCRRMHEAALDLLERVGARLDLQEAVALLKRAGARVTDDNLVHIPSSLVERALSMAPKRVVCTTAMAIPSCP